MSAVSSLRRKTTRAGIGSLILQVSGDVPRYQGGRIPLEKINVLPQPRQTFEDIDLLRDDVAKKGFISLPIVARFSRKECEDYVGKINRMRQLSLSVDDLICVSEDGEDVYWVLLAGERRYRAAKQLAETGCFSCQVKYGQKPCYKRHFGSNLLEARVCIGIPSTQALYLQLSENTHVRVPPHEEAEQYALLYDLLRNEENPKLTKAQFAREVGRSAETISNALRYCNLPNCVRTAVEQKLISYGIALELARVHEFRVADDKPRVDLEWWVQFAITSNKKVSEFRQIVSQWIADQDSDQLSLGNLFEEAQEAEHRRSVIRQAVDREAAKALWQGLVYFQRVSELFRDGKLGQEDSPFSHQSPVRLFRGVLRHLDVLLPHLEEYLPKGERKKARKRIARASGVAKSLELNLEDSDGQLP